MQQSILDAAYYDRLAVVQECIYMYSCQNIAIVDALKVAIRAVYLMDNTTLSQYECINKAMKELGFVELFYI